MQKIISLFCRNHETDRLVRDEIVPGAEWVAAGEGIATLKIDGTSCRVGSKTGNSTSGLAPKTGNNRLRILNHLKSLTQ